MDTKSEVLAIIKRAIKSGDNSISYSTIGSQLHVTKTTVGRHVAALIAEGAVQRDEKLRFISAKEEAQA